MKLLMLGTAVALGGMLLVGAGPTSPSLPVTAAFIAAGGGAGSFSSVRALNSMIGADNLQAELRTLRAKFGPTGVDGFVRDLDFTIIDGWKRAGQDNVSIPPASTDGGRTLLHDMIAAGTQPGGSFGMNTMLDALLTPQVHSQTQNDLSARYGADAATNLDRVGTQFFADLSQRS